MKNLDDVEIFKLLEKIAQDDVYKKSLKEELSFIPTGLTRKMVTESLENSEDKNRRILSTVIEYYNNNSKLHREDGPAKIIYDKNDNVAQMFFYNDGKQKNTFSIKLDDNGAVSEKVMRKNSRWTTISYENGEIVSEIANTTKKSVKPT